MYNRSAIVKNAMGLALQIKTANLARYRVGNPLRAAVRLSFIRSTGEYRLYRLSKTNWKRQPAPTMSVYFQIAIKLRRHCAQFRQVVPRDRGQIVGARVAITHV